jgi:hypothetical protein
MAKPFKSPFLAIRPLPFVLKAHAYIVTLYLHLVIYGARVGYALAVYYTFGCKDQAHMVVKNTGLHIGKNRHTATNK